MTKLKKGIDFISKKRYYIIVILGVFNFIVC